MKRARVLRDGRAEPAELIAPGLLRTADGAEHEEADLQFLLPVEPTKVIALALNYADHAAELELKEPQEPALFFKSPNTWVPHRAPVIYPEGGKFVHYEVELAVAIGRRARRVKSEQALNYIGGYTIANDLVIRDFVTNLFRPPLRGKCWDTFCPIGPYLVQDEVENPHDLTLKAFVNDELRQEGSTRDLMRKIPEIIEYVTYFMTLEPGDLILTGTPKGISHVHPGDRMRLEVEGLGVLENHIVSEQEAFG
ncbi:MAG: fumarylacetoacetate hydrolase family protein [Candidatus Dormibacteraeota bacterium]|nr:fumarylacetoacetate hydrolase family protein [Candidatus Dormibacteraeota bacterium]